MGDPLNGNFIEPIIFDEPKKETGLINPIEFDVRTKSFEEKDYIILFELNEDNMEDMYNHVFHRCIGRTMAYSKIKEMLESGVNIDLHRSIVITETKQTESSTGDRKYYLKPIKDCVSVYAFMTYIQNEGYYSDDEFDIEAYNDGDVPDPEDAAREAKLTKEQEEYRTMLEAAMQRDSFLAEIKRNMKTENI